MKKNTTIASIILSFVFIVVLSAMYDEKKPTPIKFVIPKGWPKPAKNIFAKNKLTEEGFQLGRKLFYDGNLSKDGQVSCGSCHQPFAAFSNYDHDFSHGVNNTFSFRNAPSLANVAWMDVMHWDGAINHLEVQPLAPITDPNEMGENLDSVLLKLQKDTSYLRMFKAAFGDPLINSQRMLKAIAQFVGSMVSSNSKYDRVMRGDDTFKGYELRGYNNFKTHCASCHKEPLFTDNSFRNNGMPLNKKKDVGRFAVTGVKEDSLKFKVPTLRNVQVSFPYMHDGHFFSLFKVMDHYINGIDTTKALLDPSLRKKINMTNKEKTELIYFLYTLTDSSFIKNPRFEPEIIPEIKNPHH